MAKNEGRNDAPDKSARLHTALARLAIALPELLKRSTGRAGINAVYNSSIGATRKQWLAETVAALRDVVVAAGDGSTLGGDAEQVLGDLGKSLSFDVASVFKGPAGVRLILAVENMLPQPASTPIAPPPPERAASTTGAPPTKAPKGHLARRIGEVIAGLVNAKVFDASPQDVADAAQCTASYVRRNRVWKNYRGGGRQPTLAHRNVDDEADPASVDRRMARNAAGQRKRPERDDDK